MSQRDDATNGETCPMCVPSKAAIDAEIERLSPHGHYPTAPTGMTERELLQQMAIFMSRGTYPLCARSETAATVGEVIGHKEMGLALVQWSDNGLRPIGTKVYAAPQGNRDSRSSEQSTGYSKPEVEGLANLREQQRNGNVTPAVAAPSNEVLMRMMAAWNDTFGSPLTRYAAMYKVAVESFAPSATVTSDLEQEKDAMEDQLLSARGTETFLLDLLAQCRTYLLGVGSESVRESLLKKLESI